MNDAEQVLEQPLADVQDSFGLVQEKLISWLETAIALLPNLVVAVLVLLLFGLLSKLARSIVRRALSRVTESRAIVRLLSTVAGIVVVATGVFIALGVLQLDKTVTSLLAGAGVIGLALAFAFQDLAANFISGIYLSFQSPFAIGERIITQDIEGTVQHIDLRNTHIRTPQGQIVFIPNQKIVEDPLINLTRSGERRIDLEVGVSYGDDLRRAREVAIEAVEKAENRREDKPVEFFYTGFGGSSVDFVVRFWVDYGPHSAYLQARSDAMIRIHEAFAEAGIDIPFPIRTLDFGIKGGVPLSAVLEDASAASADAASADAASADAASADA